MSFETDLAALMLPLFDAQHFHFDTTPEGAVPAGTFCVAQQVGGRDAWYVDNTLPEWSNARMQFVVWGGPRIDVSNKARALRSLFADNAANGTFYIAPLGAAVSDTNDVLKLRGSRQDFTFWYKDPYAV